MLRVAVAGGGISGLAAALRLCDIAAQSGTSFEITLYEPDDRLGGSVQTAHEQGMTLEIGADSILVDKPSGMRLLERLGLTDRLVAIRPQFKGALILRGGALRKLPAEFRLFSPSSIGALLRSGMFSVRGLARAAIEPFVPARKSPADESLASFVTRRFGSEVLDRLAQPLVGGIYSADPARLSMQAALPQFLEFERKYGSVVRGIAKNRGAQKPPRLMSLSGGLGTLVGAIGDRLTAANVRRVRDRVLDLRDLRERHDRVILATPAHEAARIVRDESPELSRMLEAIRYNSTATINLAYERSRIPPLPRAQGFVVPYCEGRRIVAATFVSQKYPDRSPDNMEVLRAFIGGALQADLLQNGDAALERMAREEFEQLLGITAPPLYSKVGRMTGMLPEYGVDHLRLVEAIEAQAAAIGIAVCGAAYRGVGIPDCIQSGERAADQVSGF